METLLFYPPLRNLGFLLTLFPGDPSRVTVAGHSAGGGSLLAHLISNGGEGDLSFDQAVVMSPAFSPFTAEVIYERNLEMLEYFGWVDYTTDAILALSADDINDVCTKFPSVYVE